MSRKSIAMMIGAITALNAIVTWQSVMLGNIAWSWIAKVNESMDVTKQLQFRSLFLNGDLKAAPVSKPEGTPPPAKK